MKNELKKTREENIKEAIDLILSDAEDDLPEFTTEAITELDPEIYVTLVCPSCERRIELLFKDRDDYICPCGWNEGYVIANHEVV